MRATVKRLRIVGVRLSKLELDSAQSMLGELILEDWPENNCFKRPVRVARLHPTTLNFHPQLLPPLFDAQVLRIDKSRLVLSGIEIHVEDGVTREVAQTWIAEISG